MAVFALALLLPVDLFPPGEVGRASGIAVSVAYVGGCWVLWGWVS